MGSLLRHGHRAWLKVVFVLAICFAAGLVTAGVVSGAGPLASLSSSTDSTTTDTTTTTETTEPSETEPTESTTTETTESTETESTETESTETTETEASEEDAPLPLTGVPCPELGTEALATDQESYPPGTVARISGTGFTGSCDVGLEITRPDEVVQTATVATNADGELWHDYAVPPPPGILGTYEVQALGLDGALLAETSFNDGPEIIDPDISPAYVAGNGARAFSILVRNTGDTTHRCIKVTLPGGASGYTAISTTGSAASTGSWTSSTSGQVITNTNATGIAPGGWGRFDVQATAAVANNTADWALQAWSNTGCGGSGSNPTAIELVQVVSGTQPTPRRYTAAFVGTPNFATGASITMTKSSDSESSKIQYFSIALPRCFTGITVTNHGTNNGSPWSATVVDNFLRWKDTSSGDLDDGQSVTVTFTATTSGCAAGTYSFWSTGWLDDTGSSDDVSKLFTTAAHPTATIGAANTAPTANAASATTNEDTAVPVTLSGSDAQTCDLTFTIVTPPASGGVGAITNNACASGTPNTDTATVTYTPGANFNGTDTFTYKVTDGGGLDSAPPATATITVNAVNDAPTATPQSVTFVEDSNDNEINLAGTAGPANESGQTLTFQLMSLPANGTLSESIGGPALSGSFPTALADGQIYFTPNENYCTTANSFTFRVKDSGGGSDTSANATVNVTVTCVNDPPTVALTGVAAADEGDTETYGFDTTDPDSSSFTLGTVSCGASGGTPANVVFSTSTGDGSFDCPFPDDDPTGTPSDTSTVSVTVSDGAASDTDTLGVTVSNLPPTVDLTGPATANEGDLVAFSFTTDDPGTADTFVLGTIVCGANGVQVGAATFNATSGTGSFDCRWPDNHVGQVVSVSVSDDDGGSDSDTSPVDIANVPPAVTAPAGQNASEGTPTSFALGSFSDPGADAPWEVTVDWGDSSADTVFTEAAAGPITPAMHTYADNGTFTVTVSVKEDSGTGAGGSATFQVVVANVPPSVTPPAGQNASEGTATLFSLGSFGDPGDDDPWQVTVDWGDGSADTVFTEASEGAIAGQSHMYSDDGSYTVTITVKEDNGTGVGGSGTFQVAVANVAPEITPPADQTAVEGTAKTFDLGSFTDPGADSPWRVTVDWGDATADIVFTQASAGPITNQSHTYADNGSYTVTLTVEEESGTGPGSDTATFQVAVANVAPNVAKPKFVQSTVGCQTTVTLTDISFTDPGADSPWTVTIDWGDGSLDTTFPATAPGAQPDQMHTYSSAGTFTATVYVNDGDDTGSNTAAVNVYQYTVEFRPPVEGSSTGNVVENRMKNGRVVPIKVRIRDLCSGADLTNPSSEVTIKVTMYSGAPGVDDPVNEYADAGSSSDGTDRFRWGGDHWIYNLDSKGLGLTVGKKYRVDVYVDDAKATNATWAILEPVK